MSLNDVLTAHANAFRRKTGVLDKLAIADMTRLLDDLSWNKTNLLQGTSDQYTKFSMGDSNGWGVKTTASAGPKYDISNFLGKTITYSATITNLGKVNVVLEIKVLNNNSFVNNTFSGVVLPGEEDKPVTVTYQFPASINADKVSISVIANYGGGGSSDFIKVKDERLYEGTEPGIWTPNPADKTESGSTRQPNEDEQPIENERPVFTGKTEGNTTEDDNQTKA